MPLDLHAARRYARHVALPELGATGQERIGSSRAVLVGDDQVIETVARYLLAAGVGSVTLLAPGGPPHPVIAHLVAPKVERRYVEGVWPSDAAGWIAAVEGAQVVVRSGFDDDALLHAALARGVPVVVARARPSAVDLLTFRHPARRSGDAPPDVPDVAPTASTDARGQGAQAVLAGTVAAAEALLLLAERPLGADARHLHLPTDGTEPRMHAIPWPPPSSK